MRRKYRVIYQRLKFNPETNKKLKPIIKFNGGRGAILCHKCRIIIKENLSFKEFLGFSTLLFCKDCAKELIMKMFKHTNYEPEPEREPVKSTTTLSE